MITKAMKNRGEAMGLLALVALLAGCDWQRDARFTERLTALGPVAAGGALYYATSDARLVRVEPAGPSAAWTRLAGTPTELVAAGDGVLVLESAGRRLEQAVGGADLTLSTLELPSGYGHLSLSPDEKFAVLTYSAASPKSGARNLNEVGVVNVAAFTFAKLVVDTSSLAPKSVVFGPTSATPRYAAILLTSGVAVIDLERPGRQIHLDLTIGATKLVPSRAAWGATAAWLFVAADGSSDIFAISLDASGQELAGSVNFLAGPSAPEALVTFDAAPEQVLAVFAGGNVALLDARGRADRELHVTTGAPVTNATLLPGLESGALPVMLLTGDATDAAYAWDLSSTELTPMSFGAPYSVRAVLPGGLALFSHDAMPFPGGSTPALTALTLTRDASSKLRARPQAVQLDARLDGEALAASDAVFGLAGESALWRMPIGAPLPEQVPLDYEAIAVGATDKFAWADSGDPLGDVTFVPLDAFGAGAARRLSGFLATGVLDDVRGAK